MPGWNEKKINVVVVAAVVCGFIVSLIVYYVAHGETSHQNPHNTVVSCPLLHWRENLHYISEPSSFLVI
jgi:hypothetical protein